MTVRNSLQAVLIGNIIGGNTGTFSTNQAYVQRLLSCKTLRHAKAAAYLAIPSIAAILILCMTSGFAMIAYYGQCDPHAAGLLLKNDQLMPYLTTYLFQSMPGIASIYISGAFAGALSTVSSYIRYSNNQQIKSQVKFSSLATVIVNDLLKSKMDNPSEATLLFVNKILIIVLGAAGIGFSYLGHGF